MVKRMIIFKRPNLSKILIVFCLSQLLFGEAAKAEILSWQKCVDLAAQQNADIRSSEQTVRSDRFLERGSYSGFFPQLTGSIAGSRVSSQGTVVSPVGNESISVTQDTEQYTASLSASQNLFTGFGDVARVQQAKANTRVANATLQISKAQISYDLKSAYQGYLYAVESIELAHEIVKRRKDNMNMVELRFDGGRENKGSVLLSRAYYNDAQFNLLQAQHALQVERAQLGRVLGLDEYEQLEVKEPIPTSEPSAMEPDYKAVATSVPGHVQAVAQVDVARSQLKVTKSSFFPSLDLTASGSRVDNHFFPRNNNWSIGLTLTLPFFTGGSTYYSARSNSALLYSSALAQASVDQKLLASLRQAYTSFVEGVEKLKVDESYREAAVVRAEISRSEYNNGLITFDDWDIIENDLIAREKTYVQSRRDRVIAEASWEQAQGKGVLP
jgi:outer membrane protein TolC